MNAPLHFLEFADLPADELRALLARARQMKAGGGGDFASLLRGRVLVMLFEKHSTRTRLSFAAGMAQLGGAAVEMHAENSQIARNESLADTARVFAGMGCAVAARVRRHETLLELAAHCEKPVINALSDRQHPCQVLADILTFQELRGDIGGRKVAWLGDGNNVCATWAQAARVLDFQFTACTPPQFALKNLEDGAAVAEEDPACAVENADIVTTDVWASMGDESEAEMRRKILAPFQVTAALMKRAKPDAIFMHCLPAKRGEEVAAEVIDGPQSAVWQEAANRMHAQKALLERLILGAAKN